MSPSSSSHSCYEVCKACTSFKSCERFGCVTQWWIAQGCLLPFTFWIVRPAANPETSQFCSCTLKEKCWGPLPIDSVYHQIAYWQGQGKDFGAPISITKCWPIQLPIVCLSRESVSLVWFSPCWHKTNGTSCRMCSVSNWLSTRYLRMKYLTGWTAANLGALFCLRLHLQLRS